MTEGPKEIEGPTETEGSTGTNPYAPSVCIGGEDNSDSPLVFWLTVGFVAAVCLIFTLVSPQTFAYGVEGLLVLVLSIGRVPLMRQKERRLLWTSSSLLILLSSLVVVTLVMLATLITFFAIFAAINGDPEFTGRDRMWGMLLGGGAAMFAFVYFYQQSKRLPF